MNAIEYQEFKVKISEYKPLIAQLRDSLNIDYLNNKVKELEVQAAAPNFWEDMKSAQQIMQKTTYFKDKINKFNNLKTMMEDCETMFEMLAEEDDSQLSEELSQTLNKIDKEIQ